MEIKRKRLWTTVAMLLAVVTVFTVIKGSGMTFEEFRAELAAASNGWLILAFCCMLGFIIFEGEAVIAIVRSCGYNCGHHHAVLYSAADIYFSAITPSATGGQPACAYFMIKDGVPGAVATAALLVNLICYNLAIMTLGGLAILVRPQVFLNFNPICKVLIAGGFAVDIGLTVLFYLLLHKRDLIFRIGMWFVKLFHKIHIIREPDKVKQKLLHTMAEYKRSVDIMSGHRKMWFQAYIYNLLQRVSQVLVTGCAYRALGGKGGTWKLLVSQCFAVIGSNSVPVPGAMGVADYLMLDGYLNLMDRDHAFQVQLLSRGISFYTCIILCGVIMGLGLYLNRRKKRKTI